MAKIICVCFVIMSFLSHSQMISTLASVNKQVITTRSVHADAVIESILYGSPKLSEVLKSKMDSRRLRLELDRFLIQKIVFFESRSFSQVSVSDSELNQSFSKVKNQIQKDSELKELWAFLTLTDTELKERLREKLIARKFIEFKNRSSFIPATDAEAFSYYQNNKSKFKDLAFEDLKDKIKVEISKEQSEQRLNDWLDILKKKYEVTLISPT